MRKALIIMITTVVAIILSFITIPLVNDLIADSFTTDLLKLPLPMKTERIGAVSLAGKLTGTEIVCNFSVPS
ncbi:hypothetical protein [Paenibacillus hexagrammi]|uniref:Uncharacterized protein n=1 Tax=Paenibacillus hexagrammi TaxID=2908839 RepID=A0ABY3SK46_9BACL|nr:hypothetical protein [Paenibacillus sp. YPD9-1]UJF34084.1 hypothetical protein L0M14_02245 [Paenibacillus sp. YPD9-1]